MRAINPGLSTFLRARRIKESKLQARGVTTNPSRIPDEPGRKFVMPQMKPRFTWRERSNPKQTSWNGILVNTKTYLEERLLTRACLLFQVPLNTFADRSDGNLDEQERICCAWSPGQSWEIFPFRSFPIRCDVSSSADPRGTSITGKPAKTTKRKLSSLSLSLSLSHTLSLSRFRRLIRKKFLSLERWERLLATLASTTSHKVCSATAFLAVDKYS